MGCCKCEGYRWPDPQEVVWTDPADGKGYCVFHAPKEEKRKALGSEERLTLEVFNAFVFSRIHDFVSMANGGGPPETCEFMGTIFPGDISFVQYDKDNPLPKINFARAIFHGSARFTSVTFSKSAYFTGTEFQRGIFDEAEFYGKATFSSATFNGPAEFYEAEFHGGAYFNKTKFINDAGFSSAIFACHMLFRGAIFSKVGSFNAVTYSENTLFINTIFKDRTDFRSSTTEVKGNVHLVNIEPSSLRNIIFALSDFPLFTLKDCSWPARLGLDIHESHSPGVLQQCEQLYRAMKRIADDEHDRRMVSDWHYAEKLAGLKILLKVRGWLAALDNVFSADCSWDVKANSFVAFLFHTPFVLFRSIFSLAFWYWLFSGFGEKIFRAGVWLVALLLLPFVMHSPIAAWLSSMLSSLWAAIPYSASVDTLAAAVRDSIDAKAAVGFIPFMKETDGPSGWAKVGQALWQGAILLQFTLFALAVRNRFRR